MKTKRVKTVWVVQGQAPQPQRSFYDLDKRRSRRAAERMLGQYREDFAYQKFRLVKRLVTDLIVRST